MDPPRFRIPLSRAVLDDPAFSPDPRAHPHFPLANARSYKAVPSKSPPPDRSSPSSSSDSSSPPSTPPTSASPATPRGSPVPSPVSPLATKPNTISKPPPLLVPVPEILPKPDRTHTVLGPVSTNIPCKAKMKAFVRRLTARHDLDRIDELDETGPFGGSYHHDGPYEAVVGNLAQPTTPAPLGVNILRSKRESVLHPSSLSQYRPAHQVLPAYGETGLSLHLEPGQILQPNTIYGSYASRTAAVPGRFLPQPNTDFVTVRPDPSRRQSLPTPRTRSQEASLSFDLRSGFQNPRSSSLHTPRERHLGDYAPDTPNSPPLHRDHDAAPYVHHQTQKTVFPPPRYESRLHASGPSRLSQRIPLPSFNSTSPQTQSTENAVPTPRHDSRHRTVHSLDSSHTINNTITQSSFSIQNKPLDPPRVRHLPKRLVMPAPLQPQPPQPHTFPPPVKPPALQDEYLGDHILEGVHFQGKPAMYSQEPRLLRKKSSAFPAKTPIPDHAPMSQDDAVPIIGNSSTKAGNEAEGIKERTRRRRLSKRKNDI